MLLDGGDAEWTAEIESLGAVGIRLDLREGSMQAFFSLPFPASLPPAPLHLVTESSSTPVEEDESEGIARLLRTLVETTASDLHISADSTPMIRHDGEMKPVPGYGKLSGEDVRRLVWPIVPPVNRDEFNETQDTDFAWEIAGVSRFRANLFADRKGVGAVFRVIPSKILTAEEMGLSKQILDLCFLTKGLVLVTGPTGSGKSTTLTAMVDYINRHRSDHIITIEDPIEFVHENQKSLVNQREIGTHTSGFKRALRAALREDPDVVLVGEMRDLETVAIAIETAETGHLVFGTLHTSSAASTVDRIIDQFPAGQQSQIRTMLASSLKGVISQTLCRKTGGGRVPALEVMIVTPSISNLIRESKVFQIPTVMQTSRKFGMCLMNESLLDLVRRGIVEPKEAWTRAGDKPGLISQFRGAGIDTSWYVED
ncbi:MAG TPA: type IV pilus twitching motility protein PilT [Thermoanaerobaculia bacterium]|nr:type IV pilus twitching motility protein PilT [Thermoanaerobaculia bacterium]